MGTVKKSIWSVIMTSMSLTLLWTCGNILKDYFNFQSSETVNEKHFGSKRPIPFPAITFCNVGKFFWPTERPHMADVMRTWGIDPLHIQYMKEHRSTILQSWQTDDFSQDKKGTFAKKIKEDYNNTISGFYDVWGFRANPETIVQLMYKNELIPPEDFHKYLKKTYTDIGTCYTFGAESSIHIKKNRDHQIKYEKSIKNKNFVWLSEDVKNFIMRWCPKSLVKFFYNDTIIEQFYSDLDISYKKRMVSKGLDPEMQANTRHEGLDWATDQGVHMGFSVVVNVHQDIYYYDPIGANMDAGIKYRVHAPYEPSLISDYGNFIGTGQRCYTSVELKDQSYYKKPWGRCERDKEIKILESTSSPRNGMKFFSRYSRNGCILECLRLVMIEQCGCVMHDFIIDKDLEDTPECSGFESIECSHRYYDEINHLSEECDRMSDLSATTTKNNTSSKSKPKARKSNSTAEDALDAELGLKEENPCHDDNLLAKVRGCSQDCPFSCHYDEYKTEISYATFPSKSAAKMWSKYVSSTKADGPTVNNGSGQELLK